MTAPVVTLEQYRRIREVRAARAALPTDEQLCFELGLNIGTMRTAMYREIERHEIALRDERAAGRGVSPKLSGKAYREARAIWALPVSRRSPLNVLARRYGLSKGAFYYAMTRGIKRYERTQP